MTEHAYIDDTYDEVLPSVEFEFEGDEPQPVYNICGGNVTSLHYRR